MTAVSCEASAPTPEAAETVTPSVDDDGLGDLFVCSQLMTIEDGVAHAGRTLERLRADLAEALGFNPWETSHLPSEIRRGLEELENTIAEIAVDAYLAGQSLARAARSAT